MRYYGELMNQLYAKNKPINKRPILCTDASRHKFIIRKDNEWVIDTNGLKIYEIVHQPMSKLIMDQANKKYEDDSENKSFNDVLNMKLFSVGLLGDKKLVNQLTKYFVVNKKLIKDTEE